MLITGPHVAGISGDWLKDYWLKDYCYKVSHDLAGAPADVL